MAKSKEKIIARNLRKQGRSMKEIAKLVHVSKSSVSIWCQDIELSPRQIEKLHHQMVIGSYKGRMIGARKQMEARLQKIKMYEKQGLLKIGKISNRNLFMVGLGLYFGEGNKGRRFQFTNSNPALVKLIIKWLKKCFGVNKKRLKLEILINQIHYYRKDVVKKYWISITGTTADQFAKIIFIKAKNKKIYENQNEHYGTLIVRIRNGTDLQYKILGLCYGLLRRTKVV